ncbi:MAG: hypothetical protein B6I37_04530 [Desulfobacteraceae bacterium 4572_35.2]|nr:MAG: hypothetical protein B6I37_04530 [Desulfobacteraceae bacterium 4572_35.2]
MKGLLMTSRATHRFRMIAIAAVVRWAQMVTDATVTAASGVLAMIETHWAVMIFLCFDDGAVEEEIGVFGILDRQLCCVETLAAADGALL